MFSAIAIHVGKWETPIAIVNLINLPLLFASSILLPTGSFHGWLQTMAKVNTISKAAEVIRLLIVNGSLNGERSWAHSLDAT